MIDLSEFIGGFSVGWLCATLVLASFYTYLLRKGYIKELTEAERFDRIYKDRVKSLTRMLQARYED